MKVSVKFIVSIPEVFCNSFEINVQEILAKHVMRWIRSVVCKVFLNIQKCPENRICVK